MNEYISKINELYITNRKKYLIMFPSGKYMTVDIKTRNKNGKPLVDSDIEEHLKGEKTFGVFAGETFSKFICFDVDVEDTCKAKWHTYRIIDALVQVGFPIDRIYPSISGNKGYHIEMFFQEKVPNKKLIELFNIVMETAEYNKVEEYTYECDGGKIELRPVANRLGVKLPLGKHFKTPNKKRCWYVDVYTLKEIRSKKFILEIKQIDNELLDNIFDTFIDLTEEDDFYTSTTIKHEITELKTIIREQYKPLKEYRLNTDNLYTVESIRKLEKEGLKQVGTRHNSLFKLARLYKYDGYSKDENEAKLLNWMKQQDKNNYRTKWEACVQDIKNIVNYVYEKDITLTVPNREIIIYKEELMKILKLPKVTFLEDLTKSYELTVYFSTHSSELIRKIKPRNLYHLDNNEGIITINNPCYPSYAIRDLYTNDGFDYLLLVEDELAKKLVYKTLYSSNLFNSRLVHVLPCGDWRHTLKLHLDIVKNNVLGVGRQVISILDGDVVEKVNQQEDFKNLRKLFLPIPSLEKYLYKKLIDENDRAFQKYIGDRYFRTRSLNDILNDYRLNYKIEKDKNGKQLYELLISNLHKTGITEEEFVKYFCDDIYKSVDFTKFKESLEKMLEKYVSV
jgi:hypothetical protein